MPYNNTSHIANVDDQEGGSVAFIQISEDTYDGFAFVCNTIINPIVCIFGLILGCLGIGVLIKDVRQQRLSIYTYLCALTFSDTVYLLLGLIRTVPNIMTFYDEGMASYVDEHMKLGSIYLDIVFGNSSASIIMVMALERCYALLRPFTVKNSWFAKYPKYIIGFCFLFNILLHLPYAMYFEVNSYEKDNMTDYYIQFKAEVVEAMDKYMLVQTFIDYIIPPCLVSLINLTIIITFSRIRRTRERTLNMSSATLNKQQVKITLTVIAITILYFLFSLPNLIIKIFAYIDKEYSFDGKHRIAFWFFIDISNMFAYLNAANDCIVYILISSRYRSVFRQMYCRCCCVRKLDVSDVYTLGGSGVLDQNGDSVVTQSTSY